MLRLSERSEVTERSTHHFSTTRAHNTDFFGSSQVFFSVSKRYGIDALSPQQLSSTVQLRDPIALYI